MHNHNALGVATKHNYALLQFMVFFIGFSCQNYSKMIDSKKKPPYESMQVGLDLLGWLGSQFGPYHFDWQSDW
jgi:hypothetical protein